MIPIAVSGGRPARRLRPPVLMSVCVAATAAFLTPVATPANMMVMGPGGYRFGDYWKLGLPLVGCSSSCRSGSFRSSGGSRRYGERGQATFRRCARVT